VPHHLFGRFEAAWPGADAQSFQKGDIKSGVNATVEVSTGRRDAPFSLEESEVLRYYSKLAGYFSNIECCGVHRRTA
jgi:hypothetical protein